MIKHKLLIFIFALVLIPIGVVVAQSSTSYVTQRYVLAGGGSANSANFAVVSVIGQTTTDVAGSSNFKVSGGFLHPRKTTSSSPKGIWLPVIFRGDK